MSKLTGARPRNLSLFIREIGEGCRGCEKEREGTRRLEKEGGENTREYGKWGGSQTMRALYTRKQARKEEKSCC